MPAKNAPKIADRDRRLVAWMEAKRDEMADALCELIRVDTENPPGNNYSAFVDTFATFVKRLGLKRVRQVRTQHTKTAPALFAAVGAAGRQLCFHGHYDVVPAPSRKEFAARRVKGNVLGRGSSDMKGGLIAMAYAMAGIQEICADSSRGITLCCVPDEETGGERGSRALDRAGLLGRDAVGMLTAEPTGGEVWHANRGAFSAVIEVEGRTAHVGLQHLGVNAFEGMLDVAHALRKLKRRVERRQTRHFITPPRARRSILLLGGLSRGGTNFNAVPASCAFTLDRRINPEEHLGDEISRIHKILDRARKAGTKLKLTVLQRGESANTSPRHPLGSVLAGAIADVEHRAPRFSLCPGLLETRFYAHKGIPAFAYGPGQLAVSHGPHELVAERRLSECAAVYALTALRLFD